MLPQLERTFLTDGGMETDLIFNRGIDLPEFASFDLLKDEEGRAALRAYYEPYIELARESGMGFIFGTPTWRASPDWAEQIGYSLDQLGDMVRAGVALGKELRDEAGDVPVLVSATVGPQGDGYSPETLMTADESQRYHAWQIGVSADAGADMIDAMTMTYPDEAIGIVKAAVEAGLPVSISFTVETDGRLPTGETLTEAITAVDEATDGAVAYYMVNCAHPTHFDAQAAELSDEVRNRIHGLRANASTMSHAELDESEVLDDGDPEDLGERYVALRADLPNLTVLGGCCGTDLRHVRAIRDAWTAA